MEARDKATLLSIASPWPIALTLATYLPAGDLINLARTSIPLRAALHGLQPPSPADLQFTSYSRSRPALRIGDHQTSYWKRLKQAAPFLCASPTHTKGSSPRPCRYCSTPICEACIVRDSFAKRNENTFKNRCRFLCKGCWNSGNPHRRCRFKGDPDSPQDGASRYNFAPGDGEFCACTNKDDGWLCISCKDMQNAEANASGSHLCFGEACSVALEEDKDRRRICLWCDRPMLRGRASIESRLAFDQKMQDARAKRGLSFEDRTRKQQKLHRMSRRELRGNEAVEHDPLADAPQFVRHLDTMNYQRFMRREHAPSGEQVYQSKLGRWVYDRNFLIEIGKCCKRLLKRSEFGNLTTRDGKNPGRTNLEAGYWKCENSGKKRRQRDKRRRLEPVSIPTGAQSAEHVGVDLPESETTVMNDDYAVALALQYELDREMAESLNAEFVADAAEVGTTQFEREPADSDSDSDEKSSRRFPTTRDFTVEADREHTLHHKLIDDTVFQSQTQSNNSTLTYSSKNTRLPSGLDDSRSSIVSEPSLDLNAASDDLTSLPLSRTQPEAEVEESNHQANIEGPNKQSATGPFADERSPMYTG
jgi:hypothetical protein